MARGLEQYSGFSDWYRKPLSARAAGDMILNKPTSLYRNFFKQKLSQN
jgi:hypothetical protein